MSWDMTWKLEEGMHKIYGFYVFKNSLYWVDKKPSRWMTLLDIMIWQCNPEMEMN